MAEAKAILADPERRLTQKVEAVRALMESPDVTVGDLVACLDIGGICAEMAAMRLHKVTGRARPTGDFGICLRPEDWVAYLESKDDGK